VSSGSVKVRQYVLSLRGGAFWPWLIDNLHDADVDKLYKLYLQDPTIDIVVEAMKLYPTPKSNLQKEFS